MKQKQNPEPKMANSKPNKNVITTIIIVAIISIVLLCGILGFVLYSLLGFNDPFDDRMVPKKPVIYLYPETIQEVDVKLLYEGELSITYPEYDNGWSVRAYPDGKLTNLFDGKEYSYLFWEGSNENWEYDLTKGFIVEGKNTAEFLQEKLSKLGLTPKEYNEFIVYWLPQMINNKYNLIHFATKEEYDDRAELVIDPKPDSMLRVFMVFKKLDNPISVEPQQIKSFERKGFSVVEWGGSEVR